MKLSLALIVKNEEATLGRLLDNVGQFMDEIILVDTGSTDNTKKIAAKYGCKIYDFEWVDDFAKARNYSFSKATGDVILWLDADDVVDKPELIRTVAEQMPANVDCVFFEYYYDIKDGVVKTKHWRERLIRNNGAMQWKGRLHETLVDNRKTNKVQADDVKVLHLTDEVRKEESLRRNLRILEAQYTDEKEAPDPRTLYYLAQVYYDLAQYGDAISLLDIYLTYSGWNEERCQALCLLANIKKKLGKDNEAINHYLQAVKEHPENPVPYVWLGEIYGRQERWKNAIAWLEMALSKPDPSSGGVVWNTLEYTYLPLALYAQALMYTNKLDKALASAKKAKTFQADPAIDEMIRLLNDLLGNKLVSQAFADVALYLEKKGEPEKVRTLMEAVPTDLNDNPLIVGVKRRFLPKTVWPKRSVVIYAGDSAIGEWGPWSLSDGIGGSEEAIIRLSRRLTEQGYKVAVYASPGAKRGTIDGVDWLNSWEFNADDVFDVLVAWRSPWMFDRKFKARKAYLWLHDVMPDGEFTPERLKNLTKVIVLSEYHRSLFPSIPDDKIFLSANGVDAEEFDVKVKRDKNQIIYASSHTRGLTHLLDIWPSVKVRVPDAHLELFYGWESFAALNKDNPERMNWMEKVKNKINMLDGVTDHGKVDQAEIVRETLKSAVWAYPTLFPEISCITAMKAQIGGAVPVVNDFAALKETVKWGTKLEFDDWTKEAAKEYEDALVDMLTRTQTQAGIRKEMMAGAAQEFSWTKVAQDWIANFEA